MTEDVANAESPNAQDAPKPLSGKQIRYLRGLAHALDAIVLLGKQGITEGVIGATDAALDQHELIKVKRGGDCPQPREEVAATLSAKTFSHHVHTIGGVVVLYRKRKKDSKIKLPRT